MPKPQGKDLIDRFGEDFLDKAPIGEMAPGLSACVIKAIEAKGYKIKIECSNGIIERYQISNGIICFAFRKIDSGFVPVYVGIDDDGVVVERIEKKRMNWNDLMYV